MLFRSVLASLGYLLLLPLQISAGLGQQRAISSGQASRVNAAERQLAAIRKAVQQASSADDLSARLQRIQAPALAAADRLKPLPLLKAQVNQALDQLQIKVARERAALPTAPAAVLAANLIRNGVACVAIEIGRAHV